MSIVQPLLDLQEVDGRIRDLQQEIKDIPQRKAQEDERLAGIRATLTRAQADLKLAQMKVKEAEEEIAARQAKIQTLKINQGNLKTNKEFQAFNLEISKVQSEIDSFEARQLAALDDVPPAERSLKDVQAKFDEEKSAVDSFCADLDERLAVVNAEMAEAEAQRADVLKTVPQQFASYYDRLRTKRWPVVVALHADGVCDGCHLQQPPSVGQMVTRNKGIVACQMCGRILYRD